MLHELGVILSRFRENTAREEEFRILPFEVESLDNMIFAQFTIQACVKLRNSSSVGVETGQYCYFQLFALVCLVLGLDILFIELLKNVCCNVE